MSRIQDSLTKSILKTFFEMALIEVVSMDQYKSDIDKNCTLYQIECTSPEKIQLSLQMPLYLSDLIIKNIYSKNPKKIEMQKKTDCILEMMNIIGGRFFASYFPKGTQFTMSLPSLMFDKLTDKGSSFFYNAQGTPFSLTFLKF